MSMLLTGAGSPGSFAPNSIPGFVIAFVPSVSLATGNLWQDLGETTLATANNDPVRVIRDPWSGIRWIAPSDAARGLLKISGGKSWIETDGVDDYYVGGAGSSPFAGNFTCGGSARPSAIKQNILAASGTGVGRLGLAATSNSFLGAFRIQLEVANTNLPYSAGENFVAIFSGTSSSDPVVFFKNNVEASATIDVNASDAGFSLIGGTNANPNDNLAGRMYGVLLYSAILSNTNRGLINTYLQGLQP